MYYRNGRADRSPKINPGFPESTTTLLDVKRDQRQSYRAQVKRGDFIMATVGFGTREPTRHFQANKPPNMAPWVSCCFSGIVIPAPFEMASQKGSQSQIGVDALAQSRT
ncbi:hypothetical protein ACJZ2D_003185 [Fusarium nematophilum]